MKKVVLLKSHLGRQGGAEKYTWRLAHALKKKDYDVTLLTTGEVPPSSDFHIHSSRNRAMSFHNLRAFDQFCRHYTTSHSSPLTFSLDRNREQTHLRASNGVHAAYLAHRQSNWLKSLSFSLNPLHQTLLSFEKTAFESPTLQSLITNSHMVKREILSHYRVDATKIQVVHNGVEWRELEPSFNSWEVQRPSLLQKYHLPRDAFHFLFIGHNYKRKGLEPLLHAFKYLPKDTYLSVVGHDSQVSYFKKLLASLDLDKRVRLFGPQKDVQAFYQFADCLVIPSYYDPFANVTVEALAMGLTVISSKTNGGHEVLQPLNGITIENLNDQDALLAAFRCALQRPKTTERARLIRQSVNHLDFEHQLSTLLQVAHL